MELIFYIFNEKLTITNSKFMRLRFSLCFILALVTVSSTSAQDQLDLFEGHWTLHLPGGAGWLEVTHDQGTLDASLLWYGGSVVPVASANITGDVLTVTRTQNVTRYTENGSQRNLTLTHTFTLRPDGDRLAGVASFPDPSGFGSQSIAFEAEKIPALPPTPDLSTITYGEPVQLFNGSDLTGWSLINSERVNGFKAENGMLVNDPVQPGNGEYIRYGNLRTDATFADFRLTLEVNVPEGSNSGIYLRGIYEVQVADTYGRDPDRHHMGALYSRIQPTVSAEKPAGEWQSMEIMLYQRHLTVILNGTTIIENQPVLGVTGGAMSADETSPGPIYLQGDHGRIFYRNLILTPIL